MSFAASVLIALLLVQTPTPATTPVPRGSIDGVVVNFKTGEPIGRAIVELRRAGGPVPLTGQIALTNPQGTRTIVSAGTLAGADLSAVTGVQFLAATGGTVGGPPVLFTTGPDGKFVFADVAPGEYRLYSTKVSGYVPGEYGQRTPTGTGIPFTVEASQNLSGIKLAIKRGLHSRKNGKI